MSDYASDYIDSGEDLNITYNGESLLSMALSNDYVDIAKKLITAGADVTFFDGRASMIWMAVDYMNYDMVKLLIDNGAKPSNEIYQADDESTELENAILRVYKPEDWKIVDLLLRHLPKKNDYFKMVKYIKEETNNWDKLEPELRKRFDNLDLYLKKLKAEDFNL